MWIEKLEFTGFGNISGEKIEFKNDKLNLVVEANEYGKSTIARAILAMLYDFSESPKGRLNERDAHRPNNDSNLPYSALMDVNFKDRSLQIVRDYGNRKVKVLDRQKANLDVTHEFLAPDGTDEVGLRLTGLTRELFLSTCFVGQRELDKYALGGASDLCSLFQSLVDSSSVSGTASTAIDVLDGALRQFPHDGKRTGIDKVIQQLEAEYALLLKKTETLKDEHKEAAASLKRIVDLNSKLSEEDKEAQAKEYFALLMEVANIETRLARIRENLSEIEEIKEELGSTKIMDGFTPEVQKQVEELWTRKQSRQTDHDSLHKVTILKEEDFQIYEKQIKERWENLDNFTEDDAKSLSSMAMSLKDIQAELTELSHKRNAEAEHVKLANVDLQKFEETKKTLVGIDARDYDDARSYNAMIASAHQRIDECNNAVSRSKTRIDEINEQRKKKANNNRTTAMILIGVAIAWFIIVAVFWASHLSILYTMAAILPGMCFFVGGIALLKRFLQPQYFRKKEADRAQTEIREQTVLREELDNRINTLNGRLDKLAAKAGMINGGEFLKQVQEHVSVQATIKGLDLLDVVISSKTADLSRLSKGLTAYFEKAGREVDISPSTAIDLSHDVNRFIEEMRALNTTFGVVKNNHQQLDFLMNEIDNINNELCAIFENFSCTHPSELEASYNEFQSRLKSYNRFQSLQDELMRMNYAMSSDMTLDDMQNLVERLESQRHKIWSRMQELVSHCPEIAEMEPPHPEDVKDTVSWSTAALVDSTRADQQELKQERDDLIVKFRISTEHYDEQYLNAVEELDELEHRLNNLRNTKKALELAKDTLKKVSGENYSDCSNKLNEIASEMLDNLGLGYKLSFAPDLTLVAQSNSGSDRASESIMMSQLSTGTKEQLHWLARMVLSRFVSKDNSLPIILDEPFSESDDQKFLQIVKFLLKVLIGQHQVIMFSCHRMRHQWLFEQLDSIEKDSIEYCQRTSLARIPS